MTTRFAWLFGLLLCLAPAAARAQAPAITLDDAIERAQRVQPSVIQARGTVRNAQAQVRSATGAYLPSLTATSSGQTSFAEGPSRFNPVTNELESGNQTTRSVSFGLSSSLDLFTGFRRGADRRAATATRDAADAGLIDAQYQVALATTQQFFAALAAQQLVRVREASVRRAEEQLNLAVAKLRVGSATRSDSLRSLVNLGNAQVQLASQQAAVVQSQAELGRLVGSDRPVAAADDSSFYGVLPALDTASLVREAQVRSPRVQNAEAQERAARAQLSASRAAYWPTLSLTGSASWSGTSTRDYELFASRDLRLQFSWPLFNRFAREQTIDARYSALEAAEASAADARRQVHSALAAQFALLEAARVRIAITRTSVAAAEEDLRVVRERYRVGAATIVDVLTSQEALTQAEVDAVNARFDYLQAKAQIEALIGRKL